MNFLFWLALVLFCVICVFLILLILIQKGRGGGLASAFGGAGGSTAFGSKTGDVLTWATSVVFGIFLVLAIILNLVANARDAAANPEPPAATPASSGSSGSSSSSGTSGTTGTPIPAAPAAPAGPSTPGGPAGPR